jgi:cytochrome c-type biogenesis protein CcmH/NrfG
VGTYVGGKLFKAMSEWQAENPRTWYLYAANEEQQQHWVQALQVRH